MVMRVGFVGMTHLGKTMSRASELRGFDVARNVDLSSCSMLFITRDVVIDSDEEQLNDLIDKVLLEVRDEVPVVIMSQVSPGFTRPWLSRHRLLFYQVDTLIVNCALQRALFPERHVVGCADPKAPLPEVYQQFLRAFPAPILRMSFEAAELTKLAVNFVLASQISSANTLSAIAERLGVDWSDVAGAVGLDQRIGTRAYIRPGVIGGHLPRDVRRVRAMLADMSCDAAFADAIGPLA